MVWKYFFPRKLLRYPFFYNIYFQVIRKNRGIVPSYFTAETDYYFDGYPRSGNTYFGHLVLKTFTDKQAVHHLHAVAPIKIALKRQLSTFILLRNPEDAISSNYLKYFVERGKDLPEKIDEELLSQMSNDYIDYYSFVASQEDGIQLVLFDDLISNPELILYEISNKLGYTYGFEEIKKFVHQLNESYQGATSKLGSSTPNKFKEVEKGKIKEVLDSIDSLSECKAIYDQLSKSK